VSAQAFREQHRAYGELVPAGEIEAHLADGWTLIEDSCFDRAVQGALMRPPRPLDQEAA
jgi:hypothetical protein